MLNRRVFLASTCSALTVFAIPSAFADTRVVQLVYFHNYSPFSWDDGGGMQGILIDLLSEALENRMEIKTNHTGYPWKRAQKLVRNGLVDAFCTVPTEERREYTVISSVPTLLATFTLFIKRGADNKTKLEKIKSLDDLKGFNIGHYLGSGWAKKNLKGRGLTLDEASTLDGTLAKLAAGRTDIVIDTSQVLRYRIKELGMQDSIEELPQVLDQAPFSLCIGKNSAFAQIMPAFEANMRDIHADGTYDKILSNYA